MERKGRPGKGEPKKNSPKDKIKPSGRAPSSYSRSASRPGNADIDRTKSHSTGFSEDRPTRSSSTDRTFRRDSVKPSGEDRPRRSSFTERPFRRESDKSSGEDRPRRSNSTERPFRRESDKSFGEDRTHRINSSNRPFFHRDSDGTSGEDRPNRSSSANRPFRRESDKPYNEDRTQRGSSMDRSFRRESDKPYNENRTQRGSSMDRPFRRESDKPYNEDRTQRGSSTDRPFRHESGKPFNEERPRRNYTEDRPVRTGSDRPSGEDHTPRNSSTDRPFRRASDKPAGEDRPRRSSSSERPLRRESGKPIKEERHGMKGSADGPLRKTPARSSATISGVGLIRLNKYIANSGICSRREADELIKAGAVSVNGIIVTELGSKVLPTDNVKYDNHTIRNEKHVYVLLNKPKGYITTTDDPFDRNTVMTLVSNACKERIYPVGRLDRNTSGLLLLTNDGDLAKKLTHPKHNVKKVYHVVLDKALTKNDMMKIVEGIELEDGVAVVDEVSYTGDGTDKKDIGIELHSGKNRIVRRIFEALGYEVTKLDRVTFAGLTKKDLPRGHWRMLTEQELNYLKMLK